MALFVTQDTDMPKFQDLKKHAKGYEGVWLNGVALKFNGDEDAPMFDLVNEFDFSLEEGQTLPSQLVFGELAEDASCLVAFYYHYKKDDRPAQTLVTFIWNPDGAKVKQRMLSAQCYGDFTNLFENSKKLDSIDDYETFTDKITDIIGKDHEETGCTKNARKDKGKARDGSEIA